MQCRTPGLLRSAGVLLAVGPACAGLVLAQQKPRSNETDAPAPVTVGPFLWRIERDPPAYLFGTIHRRDKRTAILAESVRSRLLAADVLVTEIIHDVDADRRVKAMTRLPDQTLADLLPPDALDALAKFLAKRGITMQQVPTMKVWALHNMVMRLDEDSPTAAFLDGVLTSTAQEQRIDNVALETIDEQIAALDSLTAAEQTELLLRALQHFESLAAAGGTSHHDQLIGAYLSGDDEQILGMMKDWPGLKGNPELAAKFNRIVFDERNVRMAEHIDGLLRTRTGDSLFVAVGVGHIPGTRGVAALLRDKGWSVERCVDGEPSAERR